MGLLLVVFTGAGRRLGCIPSIPHSWFNVLAGVGIWPQPWHLKHWREPGSLLLPVPSCLSLVSWLFGHWSLLVVVPVPQPADVLWPKAVCPIPVCLLWELGQPGVLLSVCPLPQPLCLGLFGALAGLLPCPGQGGHQFGNLVPQVCGTLPGVGGHGSPSPYFSPDPLLLFSALGAATIH